MIMGESHEVLCYFLVFVGVEGVVMSYIHFCCAASRPEKQDLE